MLRLIRTRTRAVSAAVAGGLLALLLGSFASACMAATGPDCSMPGSDCAKGQLSMVAAPCEQAVAPCELPALNTPVVSSFDFSYAPVVLTTVPTPVAATNVPRAPPLDWQATRPPHSPLYLTYLALLN
jgi:hypothetical protein